jgi:hypothetical protein
MRTIKNIALRLYFDTEAPERLCGDLQGQPERKMVYFQNEGELVQILHRLAPFFDSETPPKLGRDEKTREKSKDGIEIE